jgi:hypothetical protein
MTSTERLPFTQWADIHRTEKFISVEPLSGYRQALREDEGYVIYLPPDASDAKPIRPWTGCAPSGPWERFRSSRIVVTGRVVGSGLPQTKRLSFPR